MDGLKPQTFRGPVQKTRAWTVPSFKPSTVPSSGCDPDARPPAAIVLHGLVHETRPWTGPSLKPSSVSSSGCHLGARPSAATVLHGPVQKTRPWTAPSLKSSMVPSQGRDHGQSQVSNLPRSRPRGCEPSLDRAPPRSRPRDETVDGTKPQTFRGLVQKTRPWTGPSLKSSSVSSERRDHGKRAKKEGPPKRPFPRTFHQPQSQG